MPPKTLTHRQTQSDRICHFTGPLYLFPIATDRIVGQWQWIGAFILNSPLPSESPFCLLSSFNAIFFLSLSPHLSSNRKWLMSWAEKQTCNLMKCVSPWSDLHCWLRVKCQATTAPGDQYLIIQYFSQGNSHQSKIDDKLPLPHPSPF